MKVNPRPGFVTLEQVELIDKSKSGLFVPTKTKAFRVLDSGSNIYLTGQLVILNGSEKLTIVDTPTRVVIVANETAIQATIDEAA
jgi:hypothetical protein